jgi:hypothetical protein
MTWQFGILTDRDGHVHLGAMVARSQFRPREFLDLLTPVGACSVRAWTSIRWSSWFAGEPKEEHVITRKCGERCSLRPRVPEASKSADAVALLTTEIEHCLRFILVHSGLRVVLMA